MSPSLSGVPPFSHTARTDPRLPSTTGLSRSPQPGIRLLDIATLRSDGTPYVAQMKVPALPLFEGAFSAFARGTVMQSPSGDIAVEDLQPGDELSTTAGMPARVVWIGSASFAPKDANGRRVPLIRIMSDTFGQGRPDSFLTLGPSARILQTPPHLRSQIGAGPVLSHVHHFVDSVNVIEITPPTPVTLFHIVLDRHAAIYAGGLECETFHPGANATRTVSHAMRDLFLSMFPHISHVNDFGPLAHPRAQDAEQMQATAAY